MLPILRDLVSIQPFPFQLCTGTAHLLKVRGYGYAAPALSRNKNSVLPVYASSM